LRELSAHDVIANDGASDTAKSYSILNKSLCIIRRHRSRYFWEWI